MKKFTNKKGFTLVEMLIVVAIIAVLAAIAIPSGMNALDKANAAADEANLRTARSLAVEKAMVIASTDNDETAAPFVFYMNMSDDEYELISVVNDTSWTDTTKPTLRDLSTTFPDLEDSQTPVAKEDTGLSKANDKKFIRVEIDAFGEITEVKWWGEFN